MFEPLPAGPFGIILADPPWSFATWSVKGKGRSADRHYACLGLADIKALPVPALYGKHAILFLWTTAPMLERALDVMRAWGFAYKSHYAWDKRRLGTGWWTRNSHELLLIGTHGRPPAPYAMHRQSSVIHAAAGRHSAKPEAAQLIIESQYPDIRKVELFARRQRPGWVTWGLEVDHETKAEAARS